MDSITAVPFDMDDKIHVSNSIIYCVLTKKGLENIMNDKSNNEPFMYVGKMEASHSGAYRYKVNQDEYVTIFNLLVLKLSAHLCKCNSYCIGVIGTYTTVFKLMRHQEVAICVLQILSKEETENITIFEHYYMSRYLVHCVNKISPNQQRMQGNALTNARNGSTITKDAIAQHVLQSIQSNIEFLQNQKKNNINIKTYKYVHPKIEKEFPRSERKPTVKPKQHVYFAFNDGGLFYHNTVFSEAIDRINTYNNNNENNNNTAVIAPAIVPPVMVPPVMVPPVVAPPVIAPVVAPPVVAPVIVPPVIAPPVIAPAIVPPVIVPPVMVPPVMVPAIVPHVVAPSVLDCSTSVCTNPSGFT